MSDHKVVYTTSHLHQFFFDFARIFSLFSLVFRKFLEFKEVNKTSIPFALVGYETGYSQLGATRLVGYPTRAHGIIVNYFPQITYSSSVELR